jgi:hypothetical protein
MCTPGEPAGQHESRPCIVVSRYILRWWRLPGPRYTSTNSASKIVKAEGVSLAEVVRRALDSYLAAAVPDPRDVLERTFGALPDLEVPNRDEWDHG